jgi:hypothetical protein
MSATVLEFSLRVRQREEEAKPAFIPPDDTPILVCTACRGYLFFIRQDGHQCSTCGRFQIYD